MVWTTVAWKEEWPPTGQKLITVRPHDIHPVSVAAPIHPDALEDVVETLRRLSPLTTAPGHSHRGVLTLLEARLQAEEQKAEGRPGRRAAPPRPRLRVLP